MTPVNRMGPACSCGCGRPVRELGNLSTACWMGLTPAERWSLQWDAEHQLDQVEEPIDLLEVAFGLPSYGDEDVAA